jgi:hypothetical protein
MDNDRNREKLARDLDAEVTQMFEQILDYAQVACATPDTFKVLRSKILRVGNNCIRNQRKKLQQYDVKYIVETEDVIEVKQIN